MIQFKYTTDKYGWMHNFSKYPIKYGGKVYPTSEHLYQSFKFNDPTIREKIRNAASAKDAAILGRSIAAPRIDWEDTKVQYMSLVIHLKCEQYPELVEKLLGTGDEELVEISNNDCFWGRTPNRVGKNILGKIWMTQRDFRRHL